MREVWNFHPISLAASKTDSNILKQKYNPDLFRGEYIGSDIITRHQKGRKLTIFIIPIVVACLSTKHSLRPHLHPQCLATAQTQTRACNPVHSGARKEQEASV